MFIELIVRELCTNVRFVTRKLSNEWPNGKT